MTTLFTSHGAPDIIASDNATTRFWAGLLDRDALPQRIVVVSAHWSTTPPMIGAHLDPPTVHDFSGFDPALYPLHYAVKGDPDYAHLLAQKLSAFKLQVSAKQGLDHGAWIPLMAMRPQADIKVIPLSLPLSYSLEALWQFGAALYAVLDPHDWLICSGASSHNLRAIFSADTSLIQQSGDERVALFRKWLIPSVVQADKEALINYLSQAPHAAWNHPTDEHFKPLFIALGAGQQKNAKHYLSETTYRFLPMDHFIWT